MSLKVVRVSYLLYPCIFFLVSSCGIAAHHSQNMVNLHELGKSQGLEAEIRALEDDTVTVKDGKISVRFNTPIIKLLELGALYHYAGMWDKSNQVLEMVFACYADEEMKTKINVSDTVKLAAKSVFSEALGGYELSDYEKVFLHTMKALNYLMLNDLEGALVEVRRAEYQQSKIEDRTAAERSKFKEEQQQAKEKLKDANKEEVGKTKQAFMDQVKLTEEQEKLIAHLKDGYRNAVTYNVSSIAYELLREQQGDSAIDDAVLDLGKSLALYYNPGVADRFVRWAYYRHLTNTSINAPLIKMLRRYHSRTYWRARRHPGQIKNVHVFVYTGFSPRIQPLNIRIPNPISMTMSKISIPKYIPVDDRKYHIELKDACNHSGLAGEDLNFDALAFKTFKDKLPGIYTRAILRLAVNTATGKSLYDQVGVLGSFISAVENEVIEQADTRTWTSLPKVIHYGTMKTSASQIKVKVKDDTGHIVFQKKYPMKNGKILLVAIRLFGTKTIDNHVYLRSNHSRVDRSSGFNRAMKLQRMLKALGYDAGVPDGLVGPKTIAAFQGFQKDNGLEITDKINAKLFDTVSAKYKDIVREIQKRLNEAGYDAGKPDGLVGRRTRAAIRKFQQDHDLAVDGQPTVELLNKF